MTATDPQPQDSDSDPTISARTLAEITRSMEGVGRGEASPPVDLDESFRGLDGESAAE